MRTPPPQCTVRKQAQGGQGPQPGSARPGIQPPEFVRPSSSLCQTWASRRGGWGRRADLAPGAEQAGAAAPVQVLPGVPVLPRKLLPSPLPGWSLLYAS